MSPLDEEAKPPAPMLVLKGTNFEFNSAALTPEAKAALGKTIDSLKANPKIRVSVNGYTDNVGPDSYNLTLSKRLPITSGVILFMVSISSSGL